MLVSELYSDESSRDDIVDEITDTRKNIQCLKKERTQISRQIEQLMNDLQCAQRAKEVSDAAALRILRKLQELFGDGFKTEDLVGKIMELQDRARNAKQEIDDLTEQLKQQQKDTIKSSISYQKNNALIQNELAELKDKQEDLDDQIAETQKKAQLMRIKAQAERDQYENMKKMRDESDPLNTYDIETILKQVEANSDKKLANELQAHARNFDIKFDGDISKFISDLTKSINDMKI